MTAITRWNKNTADVGAITIDASAAADSTAIEYGDVSGGTVLVPAGSSLTTLTWYVYDDTADAWYALQDGEGAAVTTTVSASVAVPIPDQCYGSVTIAATGNAGGTIYVNLKG